MSREKLEQELRSYFRGEVHKKEPPQEWWNKIISGVTAKKPDPYTLGLFNRIKAGINIMGGFLSSKQPVWRSALVSIMAIVLAATLSLTLPARTVPASAELSDEALALYIAQNSDILVDAAGSAEEARINEVSISYTDVEDNNIWLEFLGTTPSIFPSHSDMRSWRAEIQVDLLTETIKLFHFMRDNITDGEKAQIQDILKADPRTNALLDEGAAIVYEESNLFMGVIATGAYAFNETIGETEIVQAMKNVSIGLNLAEESYGAHLELVKGEIVAFGKTEFSLMSPEEIEAIKATLRTDTEAKALLDEGAVIKFMASYMIALQRAEEGSGGYSGPILKKVKVLMELGGGRYEADVEIRYGEGSWQGEMMSFVKVGSAEYEETKLQETIVAINELIKIPNLPEEVREQFIEILEDIAQGNITSYTISWGGYHPPE